MTPTGSEPDRTRTDEQHPNEQHPDEQSLDEQQVDEQQVDSVEADAAGLSPGGETERAEGEGGPVGDAVEAGDEAAERLEGLSGGAAVGPVLKIWFNLAKIEGRGEDADPILREGRELALVGVLDGMGGAGGTVYDTPQGPRTGAYLASRLAREAVEQKMLQLLDPQWNLDGPATAQELHGVVRSVLGAGLQELNAPRSSLRSRLLRALPTTMALMALQRRERDGDAWTCHLFWSGDSRAYVFTPDAGACQLTVDDIRDGGDAMANLREDSVVSNAMSADTDFAVHHCSVELTAPFLAVAATDGCFGYLPTPMHFEHLVLSTLGDSTDAETWSGALQAAIGQVAGDDASMALLGVGADEAALRRLFADRTALLEQENVGPLNDLEAQERAARRRLEELRARRSTTEAQLWGRYKPGYERYLRAGQVT